MNIEFKGSFAKDLKRIRDQSLKSRVKEVVELVEQADTLQEIGSVRKLRGGDQYYRIRIGDYRMGLILEKDTVIFVRFLHRKDVYKYFP